MLSSDCLFQQSNEQSNKQSKKQSKNQSKKQSKKQSDDNDDPTANTNLDGIEYKNVIISTGEYISKHDMIRMKINKKNISHKMNKLKNPKKDHNEVRQRVESYMLNVSY